MAAQVSIPLSWPREPEQIRAELERQSAALAAYFAQLTGQAHALLVEPRRRALPLNSPRAAFGFFTPVDLPRSTDELKISLPRPDPRFAGLSCVILRRATTGKISISAPGCTVNGRTVATLGNALGFYEVMFDGEDYYTVPGATAVLLGGG